MNMVAVIGIIVTLVTAIPVILQLRRHPRDCSSCSSRRCGSASRYYGMRGLLIFYLTQHFLFDDKFAQRPLRRLWLARLFVAARRRFLGRPLSGHPQGRGVRRAASGRRTRDHGARRWCPQRRFSTYQGTEYSGRRIDGRGSARNVQSHDRRNALDAFEGVAGAAAWRSRDLPAGAPLPALPAQGLRSSLGGRIPRSALHQHLLSRAFADRDGCWVPEAQHLHRSSDSSIRSNPTRAVTPGFTLYYYGIDLGSFWAAHPVRLARPRDRLVGRLRRRRASAWRSAMVVFVIGKRLLEGKGEPPDPVKLSKAVAGPIRLEWLIYALTFAGIGIVWLFVQRFGSSWAMRSPAGRSASSSYIFYFMATTVHARRGRTAWQAGAARSFCFPSSSSRCSTKRARR